MELSTLRDFSNTSFNEIKRAKDQLRDDVMKRVHSMGLTMPKEWKDEVF